MSTAQAKTPSDQLAPKALHWISSVFFANFFTLLLITVSLSQWIVPVWVVNVFIPVYPPPSAALAIAISPILFCQLEVTAFQRMVLG